MPVRERETKKEPVGSRKSLYVHVCVCLCYIIWSNREETSGSEARSKKELI